MTVERFYNNYINSKGDSQHQVVVLGLWSVDIQRRIRYSTVKPEEMKEHRIVIRGQTHIRNRPENQRFVVGSENDTLNKIKITQDDFNWLGFTWCKKLNKGKMPSLN